MPFKQFKHKEEKVPKKGMACVYTGTPVKGWSQGDREGGEI